jgi:Bax protein
VFLQAMPRDVAGIVTADAKREFFVRALLPALLAVNEEILADRKHLLEVRAQIERGRTLSVADSEWLSALYRKYKVKEGEIAALVRAVDAVPPSLGLAQSIVESGWGTSAAARRGNAFFGQIGGDGTSTAVLARFPSMYDSVAAYVLNLNSHFAYAQFREMRAAMRAEGRQLDGMALATTLLRYSEMGQKYVAYVQGLMRAERLGDFDRAILAPRVDRPAAIGRDG